MLQWKQNSQGKSALMIDGARRIGKSYIVGSLPKKNINHIFWLTSTMQIVI